MTAPDVLVELVEAGVVLWVAEGRLRFRAPHGAVDEDLRAGVAAVRGGLVALVKAGAVLPADRAAWPSEAREGFEERAGIMEFDGDLPREIAEREAERCVRVDHARRWLERAAMRSPP